jgi:hypothetical protein
MMGWALAKDFEKIRKSLDKQGKVTTLQKVATAKGRGTDK